MSHSENRANKLASELKELPTETVEVSVQPEKARAELAMCASTMRRRTAMARPRQGKLGYGSASGEVRNMLSGWRLGRWCKELL